jgi:hypothetical protein
VKHSLTNRILGRLLGNGVLLKSTSWLFGPTISGWVMAKITLLGHRKDDRVTVLWSKRPQFDKDVTQMVQRTDLNFLEFSKTRFQMCLEAWVPWTMRRQVHFQSESGRKAEKARQASKVFAESFLKNLRHHQRIDAILTANFNYWQDDCLADICPNIQIPFLVLSREHPLSQLSAEWIRVLHRLHSYKFKGDAIAVFGALTRDAILAGNVCPPEKIQITGAPRFDPWHDIDLDQVSRDTVALMSYGEPTYFATANYRETVTAFARASMVSENCRFVLKCKNEFNIELAGRILSEVAGHRVLTEMTVPLSELFPRCKLIAGFNSLSLIEGLFAQSQILVPHWLDAQRPVEDLVFAPNDELLQGTVSFANTAEEFQKEVTKVAAAPYQPPSGEGQAAILEKYCYFPADQLASTAVADFIMGHIHQYQPDTSRNVTCQ